MNARGCSHASATVIATRTETATATIRPDGVRYGPEPVPLVVFKVVCLSCQSEQTGSYAGLCARDSWAAPVVDRVRDELGGWA